ncbi:hypothetical protein FRC10_008559, partial [Ceratobasidium sp. 414]
PQPPPIITEDGEEEYCVEEIVGWQQTKDGLKYEIKWEGYDSSENSWESAEKFADVKHAMDSLRKRYPNAPLPLGYKKARGKASSDITLTTSSTPTPAPRTTTPWSPSSLTPQSPAAGDVATL